MGLRSCRFSARWFPTTSNIAGSALQRTSLRLWHRTHLENMSNPYFALMDYLSRMFPRYNNHNHLEGFEQSSLQSFVLQYPASSLLTKTHPLPPILQTCPSLTCQTSDLLLVMTIESQHILRVCAIVTVFGAFQNINLHIDPNCSTVLLCRLWGNELGQQCQHFTCIFSMHLAPDMFLIFRIQQRQAPSSASQCCDKRRFDQSCSLASEARQRLFRRLAVVTSFKANGKFFWVCHVWHVVQPLKTHLNPSGLNLDGFFHIMFLTDLPIFKISNTKSPAAFLCFEFPAPRLEGNPFQHQQP